MNFTLQDILRAGLGFVLFSLVLVFPGYVLSWALDLFDFRRRTGVVRYGIAVVVSNAVSPIVLFLIYRLSSSGVAVGVLIACVLGWGVIQVVSRERKACSPEGGRSRLRRVGWIVAGVWVVFSVVWLVDLQVGDRLYFNVVAHDFTTRVAVVASITRWGVPPVDPTYYPGHPVEITSLYYFWYILASVVDKVGGMWVDARAAVIAGVGWCGLSLMAAIGLYLRIRNGGGGVKAWKAALVGCELLLVSGLDIIPVTILLLRSNQIWGHSFFTGSLESWNTPITTWLGALTWVPMHVTAVIACLVGMLLFLYYEGRGVREQVVGAVVAGLAFASGVGLSIWVTLTFAVFWGLWMIVRGIDRRRRGSVVWMGVAGVVALVAAAVFVRDVFSGSGGVSQTRVPLFFYVRPFSVVDALGSSISISFRQLLYLLLLPVNYLFELGFFFFVALIWLQKRHRKELGWNPFQLPELLLFVTVVVMLSFVHSGLTAIDDLGIRAWLLGQFVLVIWAVDLVQDALAEEHWALPGSLAKILPSKSASLSRGLLVSFFLIGLLTSAAEAVMNRTWTMLIDGNVVGFPNDLSPDTHLGERTYAARQAYEFIRDKLPGGVVIEPNPLVELDRPSGLYWSHQIAVSDLADYGVAAGEYQRRLASAGEIFQDGGATRWEQIDQECQQDFIDVLVVKDTDPLWQALPRLEQVRTPLYANGYYAVLACGRATILAP
jgi:hypothetical protein